jgi:hypothetical protein
MRWEAQMPTTEKAIYRSSNGDQWYLVREPGSEQMFVRHQPNRASGGQSSLIEVADFLSEGHGPQHEALLRLLGNAEIPSNA